MKILLFIMLTAQFFAPNLYAADNEDQASFGSNTVQDQEKNIFAGDSLSQFINEHEYLFVPMATTMAGAVKCGTKCAVIGGILGIADEAAVYFGLYDQHYLTWGIFGMATGHLFKESIASERAGFAVGVLLPTGIFNEHSEVIAPTIGALAGSSVAGVTGAPYGGMAGLADEVLMANGWTANHYLTCGAFGMVAGKLLGFHSLLANFVGTGLGMLMANYEKNFIDSLLTSVKTATDLYTAYNKFIPQEQLRDHIEKHIAALIGGQFLTQLISVKVMDYEGKITKHFSLLDNPTPKIWSGFQTELIHLAIFIFPYIGGHILTNSINDYSSKKLHFILDDKIRSEIFTNENALRLSQNVNGTVLLDKLNSDINNIVDSGADLVTGAVSSVVCGAYGVGMIIVYSPNIFIYNTLYNKAKRLIFEYLAEQYMIYEEKLNVLGSEKLTTFKHDAENIRTIVERDGMNVTKNQLQNYTHEIRKLEGEQKRLAIASEIFRSVFGTANFVFNYYLLGREVVNGRIAFADRDKVRDASQKASSLLSLAGGNAQQSAEIHQSLDRVMVIEGLIHRPVKPIDLITRTNKSGNQLILKELEVGIEERLLVAINELKLDLGKVYAITGESGCGKTSLLSKIKGIKENGFYGKGNIIYPEVNGKTPKIVMLSQQDYFSLNYSLYGILLYPDKIPDDKDQDKKKREEISGLLKEIEMYAFDNDAANKFVAPLSLKNKSKLTLDSKEKWSDRLSGGEKKKVLIVSAVIKKPDILILDEVFNGLDQKSTILVQQVLKKYLPNSLILIVDHHAQDNNYSGFYDQELRFANRTIETRSIAAKSLEAY